MELKRRPTSDAPTLEVIKLRPLPVRLSALADQLAAATAEQTESALHRTATESIKLAVQLIADRSRSVAAGARALAEAALEAEPPGDGWEPSK